MTKKILLIATVLLVHTAAAHAQQSTPGVPDTGPPATQGFPPAYEPPPGYAAPPAAPAQPAQPQPYYGPGPTYYGPPGYGPPPPPAHYPPPNYYYRYPPPPPRQVIDRPFTLGGGIGFGGLSFKDSLGHTATDGAMAYTFRLGFGLRPGLQLLWDIEGSFVNKNGSGISQTAHLAALQIFLTNRLFLKGGFGLAEVIQYDTVSNWGGAAMGGIGLEIIQGWHWSMDIEATVTGARYEYSTGNETWTNWSLVNFALNFF